MKSPMVCGYAMVDLWSIFWKWILVELLFWFIFSSKNVKLVL